MKKRGQVEVIGAVVVLFVVAYAGFFLIQERDLAITDNVIKDLPKYISNTENKKVCLTNDDTIKKIPHESTIFFTSLEQANQIGFIYSSNCE